jgi:hypothetical protein
MLFNPRTELGAATWVWPRWSEFFMVRDGVPWQVRIGLGAMILAMGTRTHTGNGSIVRRTSGSNRCSHLVSRFGWSAEYCGRRNCPRLLTAGG